MIGWVLLLGYAAAGVWTTRAVFYRWRAIHDEEAATSLYRGTPGEYETFDLYGWVAGAIMWGVLWPGYWAFIGITVLLLGTSPPTPHEVKAELAARDQRIADLERQLGIGRDA